MVDGKLDDAVWQNAAPTFRFLSIGRGAAPYLGIPLVDTSAQAAYDKENLYMAFRMAEPEPAKLSRRASQENPSEVFRKYDDTVVFFLNPAERLYQLAVNAGGVKYNSRIAGARWHVGTDDSFNSPWQAAVQEGKDLWTIEVSVPFSSLDVTVPEPGDTWKANFIRRFREFLIPESYWAKINTTWYDTDTYGTLVFR